MNVDAGPPERLLPIEGQPSGRRPEKRPPSWV